MSGRYSCLVVYVAVRRADPEVAAALVVEQRAEHAGGVEPRAAEPVDRPVGGDQCGGLQVADQAVFGDRRLGHVASLSSLPRSYRPDQEEMIVRLRCP